MSRSPAQKELSFLQSLVDADLEQQQQERTDSDKENEAGIKIDALEKFTATRQEQTTEMKLEQLSDEYGLGISNDITDRKNEEKDNTWEDFLTDDEINGNKESKKTEKGEMVDKVSESLGKLEKDKEDVVNRTEDTGSQDELEKKDNFKDKKSYSTKKKKRLFKQVTHPTTSVPTATGGSHPDLGMPDKNHSDTHLETMSETRGRHGRRLNRRQQVARPKCAGPAPSGDILQQKIQELHALLVKPLTEPKQYIHQTRQELLRLRGISHYQDVHITDGSLLPNEISRAIPPQTFVDLSSENSDDGYSVLRAVQIHETKSHRHTISGQVKQQFLSGKGNRGRSSSAGHQPRNNFQRSGGNRHHSPDNTFTSFQARGSGSKKERKDSSERSNSKDVQNSENLRKSSEIHDEATKLSSKSPARVAQHSDTHLKNSNNPALKKWLKQKNKEFRRQKTEEKKRLKDEKAKKEDVAKIKQDMFKDSDEKVKEWMRQKRNELRKKAKLERQIMREEKLKRDQEQQRQIMGALKTKGLNLSTNTEAHLNKTVNLDIRPVTHRKEEDEENNNKGSSDDPSAEASRPQPPVTNFVYRRPVSGHLRLMKQQQKQKEDAKKSEQEKKLMEKKLAVEKAKKMRISYDQWLLKKREEDYERRQELAKQRSQAKSDPELDRILPELARRRIENIQRGKKRINTGINSLNEELNKSFGGTDFHIKPDFETESDQPSHKLEVSGQQKVLNLLPSTAKHLNPKKSKSPNRPTSAHCFVQTSLDSGNNRGTSQSNPFKLPFPPQQGAPRYVISTQKKIFSSHLTENAASVVSDTLHQQMKDELNITDSLEKPATNLLKEPVVAYANVAAKTRPDGLRFEDNKHEPVEVVKSFFITDGNLDDVKQDEADDTYQETDDNILAQDDDNSERILEDIQLADNESDDDAVDDH